MAKTKKQIRRLCIGDVGQYIVNKTDKEERTHAVRNQSRVLCRTAEIPAGKVIDFVPAEEARRKQITQNIIDNTKSF